MDGEERRKKMIKQLREKRDAKYGPPQPKTPEEIKRAAVIKLKGTLLRSITEQIAFWNTAIDKLMESPQAELVFFRLGEVLETVDLQLRDETSTQLDLTSLADDLRRFKLIDEETPDTEFLLDLKEAAPYLPFIRAFFQKEVSTFLNTFHNYY